MGQQSFSGTLVYRFYIDTLGSQITNMEERDHFMRKQDNNSKSGRDATA